MEGGRWQGWARQGEAKKGEAPDVQDELVSAGACRAMEEPGVVALQPLGHVVGVEDGQLGGVGEALAAKPRREGGGGCPQWGLGLLRGPTRDARMIPNSPQVERI